MVDDDGRNIFALWSASAQAFEVDAFVARFPELRQLGVEVWRKGEPRPPAKRNHVNETSGFTLCIGETGTWDATLAQVRENISRLAHVAAALKELGIPNHVDFGLTVGLPNAFVRNVGFAPEEMSWFSEREIGLLITAYPLMHDLDGGIAPPRPLD